jgi:regulator of replication initiation timing
MSNTPAKAQQLSQEIQKQLSKLSTQLSGTNEDLKKEVKQVISALIVENVALKRENLKFKAEKSSKS